MRTESLIYILSFIIASTVVQSSCIGLNKSQQYNIYQKIKNFEEDSIIDALRNQKFQYIKKHINEKGHNSTIQSGANTLLSYAVQQNSFKLVVFLIDAGEEVDFMINDFSPLMICATNNYTAIAKLLIKKGANVNLQNSVKNTALIIASRYGHIEIVKMLIKSKADPFIKNQTRQTAYDYAINFHKQEIIKLLEGYLQAYAGKELGTIVEGPIAYYLNEKKVEINYFVHNQGGSRTKTYKKVERWKDGKILIKNPFTKYSSFSLVKEINIEQQESTFNHVPKIFVVGDVHGEYVALINLLRSNKIVTNELEWNYQNGHLVFIGDLFDRGENVTEILWLIYRLEQEAKKVGGKVHLLLGNHELMIIQGDHRYVNDKYEYIAASVNRKYADLFSKETILGRWIRGKNVAIKIDSVLFTHAGVSTEMVKNKISLDEMNQIVSSVINEREIPENIGLAKQKIVMEENGPLWFRGYFGENQIIPRISQEEVEITLNFYNAKKIVVGHTEISKIHSIYQGLVIPVDVPFNREGVSAQGLQIIGKIFYRCYDDGTVEIVE